MAASIIFDLEGIAKSVYEQLLLARPLLAVEGLYRLGSTYYIVAPSADAGTADGQELLKWFSHEIVPVATPISLVSNRPPDGVEVSIRTLAEVAQGHGIVRTWGAVERDVTLALPDTFPLVGITGHDRTAIVRISRVLTPDESTTLERVFNRLGVAVPYTAEVSAPRPPPIPPKVSSERFLQELARTPAPLLHSGVPEVVREMVRRDDEYWRSEGSRHFSGEKATEEPVPPSWKFKSACLVSTTSPPVNLRSYLSLYPTVIVVAPLAANLSRTLAGFEVSQRDLVELSERGFIKWLLPQSVERYDSEWIGNLADAAPNSLLMSRRLSLIAASDQRRRNVLYQFPAGTYERRAILRALLRFNDRTEPLAQFLTSLGLALSEYWPWAEYRQHSQGAMASLTGALAWHASALAKMVFKRNLFVELSAASQNVEWAGALGAHLVHDETDGYSSVGADRLCVALTSGGSKQEQTTREVRDLELAQKLLVFNNDTDVLEFVNFLGQGDLTGC